MASLPLWYQFDIFTDNRACSWLLHHPKVSPKPARYLTTFAQYTFSIHYINGTIKVVANALSHQPDDSIASHIHFHKCDYEQRGSRLRCSPSAPTLPREYSVAIQISALRSASYVDLSPEICKMLQQGYARDAELKVIWNDEEENSLFVKEDELLFLLQQMGLHGFVYQTTIACELKLYPNTMTRPSLLILAIAEHYCVLPNSTIGNHYKRT